MRYSCAGVASLRFRDSPPQLTSTGSASQHQPSMPTDVRSIAQDLFLPPVSTNVAPRPGVRCMVGNLNEVHHLLYLPADWRPCEQYPLLVELAGNGPYEDALGDVSTGYVDGSCMSYGLSGGLGAISLCLPYLNGAGTQNVRQWWGEAPQYDPAPTVEYAKKTVRQVCDTYSVDPSKIVLLGFSRGAIACNFLGLHDDEIARIWCGFVAFSHYDGVRETWPYPGRDRAAAAVRLARLGDRPQLIVNEQSDLTLDANHATREYLKDVAPERLAAGQFTFLSCGFRNHNATWTLRPCLARREARMWLSQLLGYFVGWPLRVGRLSNAERRTMRRTLLPPSRIRAMIDEDRRQRL